MAIVNPIVTKPKPKVEPPKDDQAPAKGDGEGEAKGDGEGEAKVEEGGDAKEEDKKSEEKMEETSATGAPEPEDMDVD